jgi:hypothetical protein
LNDDDGKISWSETACAEIRGGGKAGLLRGAFIYQDVFGKEHKTLCAYSYSRATGQLANNYQDGEMT